jgi:hypothetical protein
MKTSIVLKHTHTNTHTHSHTHWMKCTAFFFFGKHCSLPSRCLTISETTKIRPPGAKKVSRVTYTWSSQSEVIDSVRIYQTRSIYRVRFLCLVLFYDRVKLEASAEWLDGDEAGSRKKERKTSDRFSFKTEARWKQNIGLYTALTLEPLVQL